MCNGLNSISKSVRAAICCGAPIAIGAAFNIGFSGFIAIQGFIEGNASEPGGILPFNGLCKDLDNVVSEECAKVVAPYLIISGICTLVNAFMLSIALIKIYMMEEHKDKKKRNKIKKILRVWLNLALLHLLVETAFNVWPAGLRYTSEFPSLLKILFFLIYLGLRVHGWVIGYFIHQKLEQMDIDSWSSSTAPSPRGTSRTSCSTTTASTSKRATSKTSSSTPTASAAAAIGVSASASSARDVMIKSINDVLKTMDHESLSRMMVKLEDATGNSWV